MNIIKLRNNNTGEVLDIPWDQWEDHHHFFWTEGNYSCDCNRELEFIRAKYNRDTTWEEFDNVECGNSKYTAIQAELLDGTVIALDKD